MRSLSRTFLAVAIATSTASLAQAQSPIQAGTWTLGTTLMTFGAGPQAGLQVTSGGGQTQTIFGFNGLAGYLVNKNLEVGGNVLLQSFSGGGASRTSFGIGPYVRYWINPTEKGGFSIGGQINLFSPGGGASNQTNFGAFGQYSFFVTKGMSIDLMVPLQISTGGGANTTTFGLGAGITGFFR
ncbi:MAG: hypothetical protein HY275_19325 [Gemmatimonadetes bacterium]|nr:hypothetical protein [Gemmatimonadota bacterium]